MPRLVFGALILIAKNVFSLIGIFVPRSYSIWAVGGGKGLRYADNSMHFFKQSRGESGLRVVWLTHSLEVLSAVRAEGGEAHLIFSTKGMWLGLRARWHVFDVSPDDTGPTSCGARRLNLWHGIPLKQLKRTRSTLNRVLNWIPNSLALRKREFLLHPNLEFVTHVTGHFGIERGNVFIENLPRNVVLADDVLAEQMSKDHDRRWRELITAHRSNGKTIVGYFPTWRPDGSDKFLGIETPEQVSILLRFLRSNNCIIVTKWHTCSFREYKHSGRLRSLNEHARRIIEAPEIVSLDFHTDLNSVLGLCDVLSTDYSSVFFDYLLLDRPQLFFPYDLESYEDNPGLLFQYHEVAPGPVARDLTEFLDLLHHLLSSPRDLVDSFKVKRDAMRETFFEERRWSGDLVSLMLGKCRTRA